MTTDTETVPTISQMLPLGYRRAFFARVLGTDALKLATIIERK